MILFLNFAPIEFMGGAEKWIFETAKYLNSREKTIVISVSPKVSNLYAKLVLRRKFESRVKTLDSLEYVSLEGLHFLPWTMAHKKVKKTFSEARKIYIRYELMEVLLTFYFGGISVLRKTIAGLHSSLIYKEPVSILDYLHNLLYGSVLSKYVLQKFRYIHVLHKNELKFIKNCFHLSNVISIPTSTRLKQNIKIKSVIKNQLNILFVGDLSLRKGADMLLEVIKNSPPYFIYHIAGNGEFTDRISKLAKRVYNCKYYGYIDGTRLQKLYAKANSFFLPSRAEGFPLVYHEAMTHGIPIVCSKSISIGLPKFIEHTSADNTYRSYLDIFYTIYKNFLLNKSYATKLKNKIIDYYDKNFNHAKIQNQLKLQLFS